MSFILDKKLQQLFDLMIDLCIEPPKDGKLQPQWIDCCNLIAAIISQISPKWRRNEEIKNDKAKKLIIGLFDAFIKTPKLPLCKLDTKPKVYRNICSQILVSHQQLIRIGLQNKFAEALKYFIDLCGLQLIYIRNNELSMFDLDLNSAKNATCNHLKGFNPYLNRNRSINPLSGALICQIFKNAKKKTKTR